MDGRVLPGGDAFDGGTAQHPAEAGNCSQVDGGADGNSSQLNLMSGVEQFLASSGSHRRVASRALLTQLRALQEAGQLQAVGRAIKLMIVPTLDFTTARSFSQFCKQLPSEALAGTKIKLAILGGFTTHQLRDLIDLFLFAAGIEAEIYESDYDIFRQEILDPTSELYRFSPDILYLATHWRNMGNRPDISASTQDVEALLEAEFRDWEKLWQVAHDGLNCLIVQNNFDTPPWRALDNHEMRHPAALSRFISESNRELADRAPTYVTIHDVDALVANAGRRAWANERFFLHAKMPCAPEYLVEYAHSVVSILAAQRGLSKKCLVLDLDNTLWGGVIGDDGLSGIRLGQGDAEGEAFTSFQRYVKNLALRGVILAVCSKNSDEIARDVFESHPDMVLRLDDIACFVANWSDKATNLRHIATTLNIGLDSMVFIDDNPSERSIVRQRLPEVSVPEVTTDPLDYIDALERNRYFQVTTLGTEDFKRGAFYRANSIRAEVAASTGGLDDFLKTLDMTSTIGPINALTLERSAQLINKSNQFNLTTRRKTVADVLAATGDPNWVTTSVTLSDRFGDNGLIGVVLADIEGDTLNIDTWLMSCRVLKRGVERFLLNFLVEEALARGLAYLRGEYVPTAKNAIVRDHYPDLGFELAETNADGHTVWRLATAGFSPLTNDITKV